MSVAQASRDDLPSLIGHIAGVICHERFPTSDRAHLRRMVPDHPPPIIFYRFALEHLPHDWDRNDRSCKDWVTLIAGIALMSPHAHDPRVRFGTALATMEYSESRFERLLSASTDVRRVLMLRAARFLASKAVAFDWVDAARLLLTQEKEKRDTLHRRIAQDFYRELNKKQIER